MCEPPIPARHVCHGACPCMHALSACLSFMHPSSTVLSYTFHLRTLHAGGVSGSTPPSAYQSSPLPSPSSPPPSPPPSPYPQNSPALSSGSPSGASGPTSGTPLFSLVHACEPIDMNLHVGQCSMTVNVMLHKLCRGRCSPVDRMHADRHCTVTCTNKVAIAIRYFFIPACTVRQGRQAALPTHLLRPTRSPAAAMRQRPRRCSDHNRLCMRCMACIM